MSTGDKDDGGWKFQGRKKKGTKYSVRDFLKLKEKEIKAERIEEEEEKASEASEKDTEIEFQIKKKKINKQLEYFYIELFAPIIDFAGCCRVGIFVFENG